MVRVISQNFSPPRSRHSSGETDWDLAERADSALSALGKKRFELGISEYESSSDSFWDSEIDLENPDDLHSRVGFQKDDINGNESPVKSDVHSKRKERRRERNKLSAQAYRKRKRQITSNKQEELFVLEERNKHLLGLVNRLEKKTENAKMALRGISVPTVNEPCATNASASSDYMNSMPELPSLPLPAACIKEEAEGKSNQRLNLNMNKNLLQLPSVKAKFHQRVEVESNSGVAFTKESSYLTDLSNANIRSFNPISINANSSVGANNNESASGFPAHGTFRSSLPVKSKHGCHNTNMNYKSPILRPSSLQPVPEIPPCLLGELDDNTMAISSKSLEKTGLALESDASPALFRSKEDDHPGNLMKMELSHNNNNNNINLNNSKYDNENNNFRQINSKNCDSDNHIQINSFQLMNINGNLNENALTPKQEVYP